MYTNTQPVAAPVPAPAPAPAPKSTNPYAEMSEEELLRIVGGER